MKTIITSQSLTIPKNVEVKVAKRVVTVKGPRGTLRRSFKDMKLDMKVREGVARCWGKGGLERGTLIKGKDQLSTFPHPSKD